LTKILVKFEFRVAASLEKKPMTAHKRKVSNAFADTNPDFDLGQIGPNHKLILNKFCVVRPQFVLPTVEFEPQSNPLCEADFSALGEVLCRLDGNFVAIFNCGAEAGASVGHKHMQVLPNLERKEFMLFPDMGIVSQGMAACANFAITLIKYCRSFKISNNSIPACLQVHTRRSGYSCTLEGVS
jgi:ATP adenylyltransferase/5',5'''-P-1,P-4-tetraphosphate phosphorylase II